MMKPRFSIVPLVWCMTSLVLITTVAPNDIPVEDSNIDRHGIDDTNSYVVVPEESNNSNGVDATQVRGDPSISHTRRHDVAHLIRGNSGEKSKATSLHRLRALKKSKDGKGGNAPVDPIVETDSCTNLAEYYMCGVDKIAICYVHDDHYHNKCVDIDDEDIWNKVPGEHMYKDKYNLLNCGCCPEEHVGTIHNNIFVTEIKYPKSYKNDPYCDFISTSPSAVPTAGPTVGPTISPTTAPSVSPTGCTASLCDANAYFSEGECCTCNTGYDGDGFTCIQVNNCGTGWTEVASEDANLVPTANRLGAFPYLEDLGITGNPKAFRLQSVQRQSNGVIIQEEEFCFNADVSFNIFGSLADYQSGQAQGEATLRNINVWSVPILNLRHFVNGVEQGISSQPAVFCKASFRDGAALYGDTSWAMKIASDPHYSCGCNSGGWAGQGYFYGGLYNGVNQCAPWGGQWAGYRPSGQQKGAIFTNDLAISIKY